ncbi:MAG: sugar phosphate nucleotidyltransferase [Bacteroidales bacterium]|jgi:UTP-glucose-1-phosphate uridylyltransferase|nr:sugar phosphate nucleotidyltransferase [Bacteroidales bacterium]
MSKKPTLLILAAGIGSRYGGLKQLDKVGPCGETIIDYSVYDAIQAGFGKVVFVIRENIEADFRAFFDEKLKGKIEVEYVFQETNKIPEGLSFNPERTKPWGTGHAVLMAKDIIHENFAVINADDFYGREAYQTLADYFKTENNQETDYCMVGYELKNTLSENGFVSRGQCKSDENNYLFDVIERTHIERKNNTIVFQDENQKLVELNENTLVSMNFWGFTPSYFEFLNEKFNRFIIENTNKIKAEFYIPSVVNELIEEDRARVKVLHSKATWFGVTYKEDKVGVMENIQKLIASGIYPDKLW